MAKVLENQTVAVDDLLFDTENPRFAGESERLSQEELVQRLWRSEAVSEIALSIAASGYWQHEPIFVTKPNREGKRVVLEGNRRVAAVKLLRSKELRELVKATDLPNLPAAKKRKLAQLPAIETSRADVWQFLAVKHVNGPKEWNSYSKAKYIADVHHRHKVPLEAIAKAIGDEHATVTRLYVGFMILKQAEDLGVFDLEDRFKRHFSFSHLYTGFGYENIRNYIGIKKPFKPKRNPVTKSRQPKLRKLLLWLYGSRDEGIRPLIKSQNPDLRVLDETLGNKNGIAALEAGLPLDSAQRMGRGDAALFREAVVRALRALDEASAMVATGYEGDRGLLDDVQKLKKKTDLLYKNMESIKPAVRKRRKAK